MKQIKFYPRIMAEIIQTDQISEGFILFNRETNKGFSIDGIAASLCRKFNGKKTLETAISELRTEENLSADEFKAEIESLVADLETNKLIKFFDAPEE